MDIEIEEGDRKPSATQHFFKIKIKCFQFTQLVTCLVTHSKNNKTFYKHFY